MAQTCSLTPNKLIVYDSLILRKPSHLWFPLEKHHVLIRSSWLRRTWASKTWASRRIRRAARLVKSHRSRGWPGDFGEWLWVTWWSFWFQIFGSRPAQIIVDEFSRTNVESIFAIGAGGLGDTRPIWMIWICFAGNGLIKHVPLL